jgi:anti-anti-sigma factor
MNKILVAQTDELVIIKMIGNIKYTEFKGFEFFISELLEDENLKDGLIDLTENESIDSTNLGIIARLAVTILQKTEKKITVLCPNINIRKILESIGFEDIMNITDSTNRDNFKFDELKDINPDRKKELEIVLDAHKTLSELNQVNEKKFKKVVEYLQTEYETEKHKH